MNTNTQNKRSFKRLHGVRCIVSIVIVVAMLAAMVSSLSVSGASYSGVTDANVQKLENRLDSIKKEINGLKSKINATKNDKNEALANKKYLDNQIKLTQDQIDVTTQLILTLTESIKGKEAEIAAKEEAYEKKLASFKQRLRINREEGEISYLDMLLGSAGLSEFFEQLDRVGSMIEYDNKVMSTIADDKASLEKEKTDFEATLAYQIELKDELMTASDNLAAQAAEAASYINRLLASETDYTKQLAAKEAERDALDKEIADYVKQLQAQNTKYIGGEFMWPVPTNYTYVSSECVWRNSPISGRREFHNGMDIPVAFGTDIYASNAGTVVKSQWHNSYGYYVMIDHGGGYATLYAHNSKLLVSVGDEVTRGQVIAKAGSTGDSTGNHCHFSMYENGAIINPRKYFPA
ncbi:MAG: peptidoglycan DD-metalloendopeptidase family protein [Clostridia bacterium]|nr:peptidoglycan DD-metalloendopeptidase family protein [Clostridia bacterium]